MKIFKIKKTLSRFIEIEASSLDEACSKIQDLYKKVEIVFYADDCAETEFLKSEE